MKNGIKTIPVKIIQPETKEVKQENTQILSEHGIEIVPDLPAVPLPQMMQAGKLEITGKVQPSILAQKFSGPVSIPSTKTVHTLPNISPNSVPTPPKVAETKRTVDPYREIPE